MTWPDQSAQHAVLLDQIREQEARIERLEAALRSIIQLDGTPRYAYGEARPDGERPPKGERWLTPREKAQEALR